jgi:hypothetical protein
MFAGNVEGGAKVSVQTSYRGRHDHDAFLSPALERADRNPSEFDRMAQVDIEFRVSLGFLVGPEIRPLLP